MNNFASYYYAEMLVVAVGKKKKRFNFDQEQGEKWNNFSNVSFPSSI